MVDRLPASCRRHRPATVLLGYGIAPAFFCPLFGGGFWDSLSAFFCGLVVGTCLLFGGRWLGSNSFLRTLVCSGIASLLSLLLVRAGLGNNVDLVTIGVLMLLVPGVALTNAMREIVAGDTYSGLKMCIRDRLPPPPAFSGRNSPSAWVGTAARSTGSGSGAPPPTAGCTAARRRSPAGRRPGPDGGTAAVSYTHLMGQVDYADGSQFRIQYGSGDISGIYGGTLEESREIAGVSVAYYQYDSCLLYTSRCV